ncbi:MAG: arylsulfatase [Planctomycetes bacterium]|nr:arylsulfatase [Planctomycetota bacterium]
MTRASFVIAACLVILGIAPASAAPPRPNILLVVADDLGWADVGWHGGFGKTPVMDRLVREGVELDRHYVQPVCTPTRTALLTGRYPSRFGPQALIASNRRAVPLGTVTLAEALRRAGYATFQSGKWHLGSRPEWGPTHYGFDHGYGSLTGAADPVTHHYRPGHAFTDTWHRDGVPLREEGNATELVTAEAVRRIRESAPQPGAARRPWFVYVPFHAVHNPVDAPSGFKRLYDGVRFDPDDVRHESRLRLAAMIAQLDASIGRLVAAVDDTGQRADTLIVFTSDNGGIESVNNPYDSAVPPSPFNSENDPLRGQKAQLYEGGIRVCAFANWPGRLAPRKVTSPLHAVDWLPTLLPLAGAALPEGVALDGVDRWPALGSSELVPRGRPIVVRSAEGVAVIDEGVKLILSDAVPAKKDQPGSGRPAKEELFYLSRDPFEKSDCRSPEDRPTIERLRSIALAERAKDITELPADLVGAPK